MIDLFALLSGFVILCISALVAYTVRKIAPAALIIGAIAVLSSVAAVNFGFFEAVAPLLVIYVNGGLMGGLGGFLLAQRTEQGLDNDN